MTQKGKWIRIRGAREHNLQNITVEIPRNLLTVITGPSGSGKSSLAFDTLHLEGQRRYLETLRVDSKALFDQLRRPDVDVVEGLPPTLCVSQNTSSARPRSTLATITEIHDHLRLLWARAGVFHCPQCGIPLHRHSRNEIVKETQDLGEGAKVLILAPLAKAAKKDSNEVLEQIRQAGFVRARVDGQVIELSENTKISTNKPHTIEMVVDRLIVRKGVEDRLVESLDAALKVGNSSLIVVELEDQSSKDHFFSTQYLCNQCGSSYPELKPRLFNFNSPYGACKKCDGMGYLIKFSEGKVIPDKSWSLKKLLAHLKEKSLGFLEIPAINKKVLDSWQESTQKTDLNLNSPLDQWPEEMLGILLEGKQDPPVPFPGLYSLFSDLLAENSNDEDLQDVQDWLQRLSGPARCSDCNGSRFNVQSRSVRFADKSLPEVTALTVGEAERFFADVPKHFLSNQLSKEVVSLVLPEIRNRLHFLIEVGLSYLTLDRPAQTLSGGEAQRARLATHLGTGLLGVCYILDEPTVGLHPRDTNRLVQAIRRLQEQGSTIVLVEHDESVIRQADYLINLGPGAGPEGGNLVCSGEAKQVLPEVLPSNRDQKPTLFPRKVNWLKIKGANQDNLKDLNVELPLGNLICVTGVSGSGKSTLVYEVLCPSIRRHLGLSTQEYGVHQLVQGLQHIDKIIEVDQKPLGRSSRSNPATYTGIFEEIRKLFALTKEAKARGYKTNRFSFNTRGGRCEECQGQGVRKVALGLLPELTIPCPICQGKRFNAPTLEIVYKGKSIAEVLEMPVQEALKFFRNVHHLVRPLQALVDVGLSYLTLGQPSPSLSGGEAQRVKLATELARSTTGRTLLLLDEPTTGLHFQDIQRLQKVLQKLVQAGNTVVVIEHNLDVIAGSDWIIDLGPEAGEKGGELVVAGTPGEICQCNHSITGKYLREHLNQSKERPGKEQ